MPEPTKIKPPFGPDKKFSEHGGSVFVFGSNLAGRHGAGAALKAYKDYGAILGVGFGVTWNADSAKPSSYALPTLDEKLKPLSTTELAFWIKELAEWTLTNPNREVFVTKVGCGLAGFTEERMSSLFKRHYWGNNVILPTGW